MIILIPMAGLSSRFVEAGMAPKYTLPVKPFEKMFDFALKSFEQWFDSAKFIVVVKDQYALEFAKGHCDALGIKDYEILNLGQTTRGQAETAYQGLCEYHLEDSGDILTIFNVDSQRRNLTLPDDEIWDTLFDAFYDENAKPIWSFCEVDKDDNVLRTAEKKKISSWCSTGLYVFRSAKLFTDAYNEAYKEPTYDFYISSLYNHLKGMTNKLLRCDKSDLDVIGTPEQYQAYLGKISNEYVINADFTK